jgi:hypothetical protein
LISGDEKEIEEKRFYTEITENTESAEKRGQRRARSEERRAKSEERRGTPQSAGEGED